jgi:hypothetical protein
MERIMYVQDNKLIGDAGAVLAEFSEYWPAVAAMIARGRTIDQTEWPLRPTDVGDADFAIIQKLHAAGII